MNWFPPNVKKTIFHNYLKMSIYNPHLYSDDASVPMPHIWTITGREGNKKGVVLRDALRFEQAQIKKKDKCFDMYYIDVGEDVANHAKVAMELDRIIRENTEKIQEHMGILSAATATVIIIEHGDRLASSTTFFNMIPKLVKNTHMIILNCIDVVFRSLPPETHVAYQYEKLIYFPGPPTTEDDGAWRTAFFKSKFEAYAAFISENRMADYVKFDLVDEDYEFMKNCAPYATLDEMEGYCKSVIQSVHYMNEGGRKSLDRKLCESFMKCRDGAWVVSLVDGYAKEQEFLAGVGINAIPPLPERTDETIVNKKVYESGAVEEEPDYMGDSYRFTMDKDGNEQPIEMITSSMLQPKKRPREDKETP